ncbi:DeoR/GlpR family DNA-binding transcription regulator [Labrys wisconsinensis]|uniref:DeoR family ulaG and ulaABCDEF operon transcriptional repressor n=1 Tax=Labrys wisconsinensis TaxID=425677 RepID=A0ABU0J1V9_9HYPH|nr:DeoR/GlpR family DNA-binding transcription regulator [Labrys wisconsinensis]MDQ0468236.1 DeoR family ulaG and ulaABCDEF operon transcriptional repressor [Labrys wisconsinensis]
MHERERWQAILEQVRQRAVMPVRDLAGLLDASPATLRRDLTKLAEMGLLRRVHGAVEAVSQDDRPQLATRSFDVSRTLNGARKRVIARAAVDLCRDGESIIINGGTTTGQMIEFLRPRRLHILTNSFPVAEALVHDSENRIVLPGGEIYREQNVIVSPFDDDSIQHYTASKMFMSALSIGPLGVIEGDPLLARAEAKLLKRAADLIVLADSSKFEPRGNMAVAPLSRIHTLITDDAAPASGLAMLRDAGVRVIIAQDEEAMIHAA